MFTAYSKVLILKFLEMKKTVFFPAKKLIEIWYLLITENFLVLKLWEMGNAVFFWSQKVDGKMIFTDYSKVLVLNFSVMGSTVFFSAKRLMERLYLFGLFGLSMIFKDLGNMVFRAVHFTFSLVKLLLRFIFFCCISIFAYYEDFRMLLSCHSILSIYSLKQT